MKEGKTKCLKIAINDGLLKFFLNLVNIIN